MNKHLQAILEKQPADRSAIESAIAILYQDHNLPAVTITAADQLAELVARTDKDSSAQLERELAQARARLEYAERVIAAAVNFVNSSSSVRGYERFMELETAIAGPGREEIKIDE